jgi:2-amino-4-hydroxy-6-hydroxymethyldihydropteridine diphosphokinase
LVRASRLFSSAPIESSGPDYVNAVAQISTALSAPSLLAELQTIELAAGRERPFRNAPRTLDLDVLLYGSAKINSPVLTVPHPRMYQRAFVLLPLAEVAPELVSTSALAAVQGQVLNVLATQWHADGHPLSP